MHMHPGGTSNVPAFNVPASVVAALAAIALVHGVRALLSVEDDFTLVLTLAFIPARYAAESPLLPGGGIAGVTSFATYMLVHGDAMHLAVNAIWMLAFGSAVAKRLGGSRFFLFSLCCGVAGAVTHLGLHFGELIPVVGASAAISGQMAGALRFLFSAGPGGIAAMRMESRSFRMASVGETLKNPRFLAFLGIWAGLNLIFGLGYVQMEGMSGDIAWEAHLGGFLFGLLTIGLFDPPPERPSPKHVLH